MTLTYIQLPINNDTKTESLLLEIPCLVEQIASQGSITHLNSLEINRVIKIILNELLRRFGELEQRAETAEASLSAAFKSGRAFLEAFTPEPTGQG